MRKKYIALKDFQLITYIRVKGKEHICKFTGGFFNQAEVRNGSYTTSDKDIQDALEKDKRFGSLYALVSINGLPLSEYNAITEDGKDKELNKSYIADKEGVDNNDVKEVEYINLEADKKQLAIEELISRVPKIGEIDKRITIAELKALANVNGYDFPNMISR